MTDATPTNNTEPVAAPVNLEKTADTPTPYFHTDAELQPAPELATGTLPNVALTFGIISATWWLLFWLSTTVGENGSALGGVLLGLGFPVFGLWIAGLILAHKGFSRRVQRTPANRGKLIAALVLVYAQTPFILGAIGLALIGILFFGALLGGAAFGG